MEPGGLDNISINSPSDAPSARNVRMRSPAENLGHAAPRSGPLGRVRAGWSGLMKGTIFSSIFTLLTTCIGAGTLSLPFAFQQVRPVLSVSNHVISLSLSLSHREV